MQTGVWSVQIVKRNFLIGVRRTSGIFANRYMTFYWFRLIHTFSPPNNILAKKKRIVNDKSGF